MRRMLFCGGALALGLAAWLLLADGAAAPMAMRAGSGPEPAPPAADAAEGKAEVTFASQSERQEAGPQLRILVRDMQSSPVPKAAVEIWRRSTNRSSRGESPVITEHTQPDGTVAIPCHSLGDVSDLTARATAPGFAYAWLSRLLIEEQNVMVLAPECSATFRCTREDGSPVADVVVQMCGAAFDVQDGQVGVPLGATWTGVHGAVTDAAGICRIGGLERMHYSVRTKHPWALLKTKLVDDGGVTVAGDVTVDLQFEEPLVAAAVMVPRPTIRWQKLPGAATPHPTMSQPTGLMGRLWDEARTVGGLDAYFFALARAPRSPATSMHMEVVGFVPDRGWITARVPYRRASEARVERIHAEQAAPTPQGEILVEIVGPDGSRSVIRNVSLRIDSFANESPMPLDRRNRSGFPLVVDQPLPVPCGVYGVVLPSEIFGAELEGETTATVTAGARATIRLREKSRVGTLELAALTSEGTELTFFHVVIVDAVTGRRFGFLRTTGATHCSLLAGSYRVEVHAPGHDVGLLEVEVPAQSPFACAQTIVLERSQSRANR